MNATIKNLLLWMVILVLIILAWNVFKTGATAVEEVAFSQFLDQVNQGHVQKVQIRGEEIRGQYAPSAGKREPLFKTYAGELPRPRSRISGPRTSRSTSRRRRTPPSSRRSSCTAR